MDKKTILALILIMVVFWISNELIWKKQKQPQPVPTREPIPTEVEKKEEVKEDIHEIETLTDNIFSTSELEADIENDIKIENDYVIFTFSNKGGLINSVLLKKFFLSDHETFVNLIPQDHNLLNIQLETQDENIINLSNQVFQYHISENKDQVFFLLQTENGTIEKIFTLTDEYNLDFNFNIEGFENITSYQLALDSGIADTEEYIKKHPKEKLRDYKIFTQINNEIEKISLSKLKNKKEIFGKIDWAAVRSKYFVMGIYPHELIDVNKIISFNNNNSPALKLGVSASRINFKHGYSLYFGPLINTNLVSFKPGFEKVLEGPFIEVLRPISSFFAWTFKILRNVTSSYGLIIIIVAVLLKIILYPLTHKSFESTQKMQKISPLMKEIQAKYKSDPKTMNLELKKLYREHGVSPLGGCLPMLLQMPVIFAIYPVVRYSIDLRQSSFLWLPDLSEPDRLLILPIAMAIFMFVQQKLMSPSKDKLAEMNEKQQAAQQSQKMMMYLMPVLMFFIFKSLSSGLVLYWTVFSIIGSIQQYFIKKKLS